MPSTTISAYTRGEELAGKVALVTGAARNIGRATALALAAGGAAVALNTRASKEDAEKVVNEIRGSGGQAELCVADIANEGAVKAMADSILKRFGRIPISGGEHEHTLYGFRELIEARAVDYIQFDTNRVGGFTEAGEIYRKHSWLRLPIGAHFRARAATDGCRVWVKEGHLRQVGRSDR